MLFYSSQPCSIRATYLIEYLFIVLENTTTIKNQKKEIIKALNNITNDLKKLKMKWKFTNGVYSRYYVFG